MTGYWFKSTLFQIEPDEDVEVNPGRYGRQLAFWLKAKLEQRGFEIQDVFPEDWGWCVRCHAKPFQLWVGCGNMDDAVTLSEDVLPLGESVIWHCFPVAEVPPLAKLFGKIDAAPALARLDAAVLEILDVEPAIQRVDAP
ncbi:hypothetical protein [Dyella subtropica]|uniref:hypothetical protein n=1 Tax=Dyella subtropica TaxID=2992127 RepID=UPI002259EDEA|nr:hypothetical protein [Dyella subtropica]